MTEPTKEIPTTPPDMEVKSDELSTNFFWTSSAGFPLQTTLRGNPSDAEILAHLEQVRSIVHAVMALNGAPKQAKPPAPASTVPQATTAPQAAPSPQSPHSAPKPAATREVLSLSVVKMEVVPKPDNKSEVRFFVAGHKFPDLYTTRTIADLVTLMAPTGAWETQHFVAAQAYDLTDTIVDYTLSEKLNSRGNPYRDIIATRRG